MLLSEFCQSYSKISALAIQPQDQSKEVERDMSSLCVSNHGSVVGQDGDYGERRRPSGVAK